MTFLKRPEVHWARLNPVPHKAAFEESMHLKKGSKNLDICTMILRSCNENCMEVNITRAPKLKLGKKLSSLAGLSEGLLFQTQHTLCTDILVIVLNYAIRMTFLAFGSDHW